MGWSPARAWPGPKVPVIGVMGNPADLGTLVLGPSPTLEAIPVAEERPLEWLRRKALADGGGRLWTSTGGVMLFLGGDGLRKTRIGALSSGGGET